MSPEDIKIYRKGDRLPLPEQCSDVFSLGVVLLEMCNLERKGESKKDGLALFETPAFSSIVDEAK